MNKKFFFASLVFLTTLSFAQKTSLPIALNIQKAIANGTRSLDGKPGPNYWQNSADYKIKAELEPKTRTITGDETITYYNNSPDTLKQIVVKVLQDLYRKGNTRDFEISPNDLTDGLQSRGIFVNGEEIKTDGSKNFTRRGGTNVFIPLPKPLAPKSKTELKFGWSFTLPKESNVRMGTYDSTSFFVAYWYPQVAVYDDIDGWDVVNYTGQTETYNDFSNYEVEITIPKNFIVWGTGLLQNPEEVLAKEIFERYKNAYSSDAVMKIVEEKDYQNGFVTTDKEKITYKIHSIKEEDKKSRTWNNTNSGCEFER